MQALGNLSTLPSKRYYGHGPLYRTDSHLPGPVLFFVIEHGRRRILHSIDLFRSISPLILIVETLQSFGDIQCVKGARRKPSLRQGLGAAGIYAQSAGLGLTQNFYIPARALGVAAAVFFALPAFRGARRENCKNTPAFPQKRECGSKESVN